MLCKPAEAASSMAVRSSILVNPTRSIAIDAGLALKRERLKGDLKGGGWVWNWGRLRRGSGGL